MRAWTRQLAYEDRNRLAGLCTRSKQHGPRDPRSKNLCALCLKIARETGRDSRRAEFLSVKKPVQRAEFWKRAA